MEKIETVISMIWEINEFYAIKLQNTVFTRPYTMENGGELIKLFVNFIIQILLTVHFKVHFMSKSLFILPIKLTY